VKEYPGTMKSIIRFAGVLCLAAPLFAQETKAPVQPGIQSPKRIYIEEHQVTTGRSHVHCDNYGNCNGRDNTHTTDVAMNATVFFARTCSEVIVTDNREAADYVLRNKTLYKQNGDVVYVSSAVALRNVVKDVCNYVKSAQPH
jgi:hypothetical protein